MTTSALADPAPTRARLPAPSAPTTAPVPGHHPGRFAAAVDPVTPVTATPRSRPLRRRPRRAPPPPRLLLPHGPAARFESRERSAPRYLPATVAKEPVHVAVPRPGRAARGSDARYGQRGRSASVLRFSGFHGVVAGQPDAGGDHPLQAVRSFTRRDDAGRSALVGTRLPAVVALTSPTAADGDANLSLNTWHPAPRRTYISAAILLQHAYLRFESAARGDLKLRALVGSSTILRHSRSTARACTQSLLGSPPVSREHQRRVPPRPELT